DAPDQAKEKIVELRARAKAANDWARAQEDALDQGQRTHDETLASHDDNVVPLRPGAPKRPPSTRAHQAARRAGHAAYSAARPRAMRIVDRSKQHFFQGVAEPFGPVGASWDLAWEAIGVSLAVIVLVDLLRHPGALTATSTHAVGLLDRAVGLVDPITGLAPARAVAPTAAPRPAPTPAQHA